MSDFWVLSTYFNPARYANMATRFRVFRDALKSHDVCQVVVELVFDGVKPELNQRDADIHIVVNGNDSHLMWQKEALLNIALNYVPDQCTYVAWLDNDVCFERDDWVETCRSELTRHVVVQPFSHFRQLSSEWGLQFADPVQMARSVINQKQSFAAGFSRFGTTHIRPYGFTGCAWAARKEFLLDCKFFPFMILGDGDSFHAYAFTGAEHFLNRVAGDFPTGLIDEYREWAGKVTQLTGGRVGLVEGNLYHLYHGSQDKRRYGLRRTILKAHDYQPSRDVRLQSSGVLCWNTPKHGLRNDIRSYFYEREEDDSATMMSHRKRVLITGMAGVVGGIVGQALRDRYHILALSITPVENVDAVYADIRDVEQLNGCMNGIDTVIHFASYNGGNMSRQIDVNYRGTWNLLEEAKKRKVRRFVYISSGAVQQAYEYESPIRELIDSPDDPVSDPPPMLHDYDEIRPTRPYGAMKAAVEIMARMYAETTEMSVICLRLGRVYKEDMAREKRDAAVYLSHRDLVQLVHKSIEAADDLKFGVYYGVSANRTRFRDIEPARRDLGYVPIDGIR